MPRISLRTIALIVGLVVLAFILYESSVCTNYTSVLPTKCNCSGLPAQVIASGWEELDAGPSTKTNTPLAPCKLVEKDSAVQRAVVIYYPHHQSRHFFPEVRWLYRSWAEMLRDEPATWRTDLIIFTSVFSADFRTLKCVNRIRQNREEPSMCRLFIYFPVIFRFKNMTDNNFKYAFHDAKTLAKVYNDSIEHMITLPVINDPQTFDRKRSESLHKHLRKYHYVDSINVICEGYHTFKMYDFILRTDIDVFIYRHFATYIPQNCTFIAGRGGYSTHFNQRKLKRIARDMGFAYANLTGMGSTWYGSPHDGFLVANQTLYGMLWLSQYEFTTPERESRLGSIMWPEWHYGVLLLYGQHLALNHLVATNQIRMIIGTELLDQSSTDDNPRYLQQSKRLNLHCWHTHKKFSKFAFKRGQYNQSDLEEYRNDRTAQAYAMRMALESKYMTLEELANLVQRNTLST